jgi:hypothetical protein
MKPLFALEKYQIAMKVAIDAIAFMTMPVTTPKESLTVDRLLATMKEDHIRGRKALKEIRRLTGLEPDEK